MTNQTRLHLPLGAPTVQEWVTALESGKYTFGTGVLRDERSAEVKHCALGVYADLCVQRGIGAWAGGPEGWEPYGDGEHCTFFWKGPNSFRGDHYLTSLPIVWGLNTVYDRHTGRFKYVADINDFSKHGYQSVIEAIKDTDYV